MPPKKPPPGGPGGGEEEEEAEGIALLLRTIWEEAFAYQSIKIIKIPDWRLTREFICSSLTSCSLRFTCLSQLVPCVFTWASVQRNAIKARWPN